MENLWAKVKQHPYMAIAIVLGIFILVYLLVGGSGSQQSGGTPNDNYAAEVAAATQLQNAQLQAQTQGNAINAQLAEQQGQMQAATTIAQLQAQTSQQNIAAQQDVAEKQIAAAQEATDLQTSTYAQIQANNNATQQAVALAGFNAEEAMNTQNGQVAQTVYSKYFDTLNLMNTTNANVATYGIAQNALVDQFMVAGPGTAQASGQLMLTGGPGSSNFGFGMFGGSSIPGEIAQHQISLGINPNTGQPFVPSSPAPSSSPGNGWIAVDPGGPISHAPSLFPSGLDFGPGMTIGGMIANYAGA
jgi:hypothetical protein